MGPEWVRTRREFLGRGLALVGAGVTIPSFLQRSALAVAPAADASTKSRPGVPEDRVLVVVQLSGGNDGLNTVIPIGNELYYQYRPQLAVKKDDALKINSEFGLHPALADLKGLYDEGLLGIVHGVGYPNPNRSHFKSMDIWHTASPDGRQYTGWIGRYFDNCCNGEDCPAPEAGIALMGEAPYAMRGTRFQPVAFQSPDSLAWRGERGPRNKASAAADAFAKLNMPQEESDSPLTELDYLERTAMNARLSGQDIRRIAGQRMGAGQRGGRGGMLGSSLATVARMIAAGMPTRVYYVSQSGYDTHSGQAGRHPQLLGQFAAALKGFMDDLKATGHQDRVVVMTFSEFGRRVRENASGGTDHGQAAPMFLLGTAIKPGFHGRPCSLQNLDQGDLRWTTDFREVYAAMIQKWLGGDPRKVVGMVPRLQLLKV